jgi:hypothetical protein
MYQKIESSEKKSAKKTSNVRNNRDSVLLHFMFIRDEITSLPRSSKSNHNKKLDDDRTTPQVGKAKTTSSKTCRQKLAEEKELNDRLLSSMEAYEHAIQRIDLIALHAMSTLGDVQVGGRKPKLEIKEMAIAIAKKHLQEKKKLPTWKELYYKVRHELFKKNPQRFIEMVKKGMDDREVLSNSIDPSWSYWSNVDGLVSERTLSTILTSLRK